MPGNRALHWPHKLYQPRHIAMDTQRSFLMLQKLNEWNHNKIFARFDQRLTTSLKYLTIFCSICDKIANDEIKVFSLYEL